MVVSETFSVMLTTHAKFREFTPKAVCDTGKAVEALFCLACESREEVDGLVAKALAAVGTTTTSRRTSASCIRTASSISTATVGGVLHLSAPS